MIRAYVGDHQFGYSVGVAIVRHHGDEHAAPASILRLIEAGENAAAATWRWDDVTEGAEVKPTFVLNHEVARALLDGLNSHYSGVEDTRALRRDYDGERKRVDKLTDALTGIAQTIAGQEFG